LVAIKAFLPATLFSLDFSRLLGAPPSLVTVNLLLTTLSLSLLLELGRLLMGPITSLVAVNFWLSKFSLEFSRLIMLPTSSIGLLLIELSLSLELGRLLVGTPPNLVVGNIIPVLSLDVGRTPMGTLAPLVSLEFGRLIMGTRSSLVVTASTIVRVVILHIFKI